jgi:septal ring factor EnvC (AmiA/AmiB activator)
MRKRSIEQAALRTEILEGLQRALDHHYRRLAAAARREWRERFGGKERTDRSVSIRINTPAKKARIVPTAGFLSARTKLARAKRKFHFPGFAH